MREGVVMYKRNITIFGQELKSCKIDKYNYVMRVNRQLFHALLLMEDKIGLEYPLATREQKAFSRLKEAGILLANNTKELKKWINFQYNKKDLYILYNSLNQKLKDILIMQNLHIISPSKTGAFLKNEIKEKAIDNLLKYFNKISFSKHFADEATNGFSTSVETRIDDLHKAFENVNIDFIMAYSGGFNSNQLLDDINWDIIKQNPKPFCGMSDITVLCNAIFVKTGIVTFLGPVFTQFATFADNKNDFSEKALFDLIRDNKYTLQISKKWSDDRWNSDINKNEGVSIFNKKDFSGTLLGGNLSSFSLLFQTPYMPKAEKIVLLLEEDDHIASMASGNGPDFFFERELLQISQTDFFEHIQAILIGRFKKNSFMNKDKIEDFIKNNKKLQNIPIIYGLDFGHTNPLLTFPIGGMCHFCAQNEEVIVSF